MVARERETEAETENCIYGYDYVLTSLKSMHCNYINSYFFNDQVQLFSFTPLSVRGDNVESLNEVVVESIHESLFKNQESKIFNCHFLCHFATVIFFCKPEITQNK